MKSKALPDWTRRNFLDDTATGSGAHVVAVVSTHTAILRVSDGDRTITLDMHNKKLRLLMTVLQAMASEMEKTEEEEGTGEEEIEGLRGLLDKPREPWQEE